MGTRTQPSFLYPWAEDTASFPTCYKHERRAYDGSLVIHFKGTLLSAISGGPTKENQVAVLVSGPKVEKLLEIPKVEKGTGENIVQVALQAILEWNVQDQIIGMFSDTTAVNTGRLNGECVLLE